jgi:hypothetical protein
MTIDEAIANIDGFLNTLETEMPKLSDEVALDALALIKNRIIDQGKGIEGAAYSTKPMLATKEQFIVKSRFKQSTEEVVLKRDGKKNKKGQLVKRGVWLKFPKAKKAVAVMKIDGGYREFREIQGRPGDHVNLSYSGKMWQGTTIVARARNGYTWVTIIGGGNQEAQDKLSWMTDKYGKFLSVTDEEEKNLSLVFDNRIKAISDKFLI